MRRDNPTTARLSNDPAVDNPLRERLNEVWRAVSMIAQPGDDVRNIDQWRDTVRRNAEREHGPYASLLVAEFPNLSPVDIAHAVIAAKPLDRITADVELEKVAQASRKVANRQHGEVRAIMEQPGFDGSHRRGIQQARAHLSEGRNSEGGHMDQKQSEPDAGACVRGSARGASDA